MLGMLRFSARQEASSAISDFCQKYPAARATWMKKGDLTFFFTYVSMHISIFNGKIEIVMLRSLHMFQHRIFVGLMFGVLAGNL